MSDTHESNDVSQAIAEADAKVSPDEVPVCEFTGGMVMPQTEGKPMLVFRTEDDGTVAVRMEDDEAVNRMIDDLRAVIA